MKTHRAWIRGPWLMTIRTILISVLALLAGNLGAADPLAQGFANPPEQTKPWCYWYWISDHISKEGITRDLEAMARVGIGEALIGNIFLEDMPAGKIKVLTPEWWALVEHALREGGRTGVNIGLFNCPGWSQSGGPWIKPEQAMRYLTSCETRITGPARFEQKLSAPRKQFQDVALLAFPAPQEELKNLTSTLAHVTCMPQVASPEKLADGDTSTSIDLPSGAGQGKTPFMVEFERTEPFTVRSLQIFPAAEAFSAQCELQAIHPDGSIKTLRQFKCDRSNMSPGVGFMPRGPVAVSVPPTTSSRFRVVFTSVHGGKAPRLAEVQLSSAARLECFIEKQLGKMHPTPLPMWDTYLWPTQAEPEAAGLVVPQASVRDLTKKMASDGMLKWDVPAGDWIILRVGMTPTRMSNSPASPEGTGLEVDKMNRRLARYHFDSFIGEVLKRVPASGRKAFKEVVADSYEMGSQNWTDGFDAQFQKRYGYDPKPWLPVLTGRLVGSADQSERFLWDLRRLVADRIATEYVGGLRAACKPHGLGLWLENYGHWGFPSEFLKYGSESDRIGGEYWVTGELGSIECRAASSCANTYGQPFVSAESFTGGPHFQNAPAALKARGDWAFCEGVNHFVLHVYIQQPWADKVPGVNAWFGTEFNRHNTWFDHSKSWVEYLRRSCWLLQQGTRAADVAYFIGEDAPKMTGVRKPELPPGRDFDYINADVIENALEVKNGVLTLPHGTTYRLLVLPDLDTMRPKLLRKIHELVKDGATIVGRPPSRSPSMEKFPRCDDQVKELAREVWGGAGSNEPGERRFGKGRVVWGKPLADVLGTLGSKPDFQSSVPLRFTHRRSGETEIYFVANPKPEAVAATVAFRAGEKAPEFWWPDSGQIERPAVYDVQDGLVRVPLSFGPHGSVFVVFREKAAPAAVRIVSVRRNGEEVMSTKVSSGPAAGSGDSPNNFTLAAWVKPAAATPLFTQTNRGVVGLGAKRNDALNAPHGNTFGGDEHAGCGLAVGTNGVCLFEHGANYFAPTLVYTGALIGWTHLAVVYRDAQPTLFLNGVRVHSGLRSEHIVHSGAAAGGLAQFRGRLGSFTQISRALEDAELTQLARSMPQPEETASGPGVQITRVDGAWKLLAAMPGSYELWFADGKTRPLRVTTVPAPQVLSGPWEVQFAPGWGAPERTTFEQLVDWTQHPVESVRHFSGKATYRKSFEISAPGTSGTRVMLDLGEVRDVAALRVNSQPVGTLWHQPFRLDITRQVRPGTNALEVDVVNVWNNRLVGDMALPPEQRKTFLLAPTVSKSSPLLPAGLLGPVALKYAVETSSK